MEVLSLPGGPGIGDTQSYQGPLTARLCSMSYPNHRFFVQRRYGGSLLRFASYSFSGTIRVLNARLETENRAHFAEGVMTLTEPQL